MVAVPPGPDFGLAAFRAAAEAVRPRIVRTPLLRAAALSEATGADVWLKCETFQRTHSFKDRAAFGALLPRLAEARRRGVATSSSGNFAQAVAYAGRELGVPVLLEEAPDAAAVVVPVGGGGLIAGVSAVLEQSGFGGRIYGVQPERNPSFRAAIEAGHPVPQPFAQSSADGLLATAPGETGFALSRRFVDAALDVSEDDIARATVRLAEEEKVLAEPSGAVAVAALVRHLAGTYRGRKVVCLVTGANIMLADLARLAAEAPVTGA